MSSSKPILQSIKQEIEAVEETLRVYDGKLEFLTMDNSEAVIVDGAEHRVEREA